MFCCQMPDCDFISDSRSQIDVHHIIPRSMGGTDKRSNLIELCPNCHRRILVEGAETGIHSIENTNSIIIMGKMLSTGGYVISYKDINDDEIKYSLLK